MQTFLPYPDFRKSIESLDKRRKWKQAVEADQIYDMLTTGKKKDGLPYRQSSINHPAIQMWKVNIAALTLYRNIAVAINLVAGINTKMRYQHFHYTVFADVGTNLTTITRRTFVPFDYEKHINNHAYMLAILDDLQEHTTKPLWLGLDKFHNSHKSKLLQKDEEFYKQYEWDVPLDLEYFWPTKNGFVHG